MPLANVHFVPHLPQLFTSTWSEVSQPSAASLLQSPQPAKQAPDWHLPPTQVAVLCWPKQAAPQAPQFAASLSVSMQRPLQQAAFDIGLPARQRSSLAQPGTQPLSLQMKPAGQCSS